MTRALRPSARVMAGVLIGLAFFAALVLATLREAAVECEVCVSYAGRSACRVSSGPAREQAIQMAHSTACAVLAGGVTDGMACQRVVPTKTRCGDEP